MNSNSSALIVPPPSSATAMTNDIHGIKPPVEIPNDWAWVWWVAGTLLLTALTVLALRWWRKNRVELPSIPAVPLHVRAKIKLREALFLIHDPRLFCIAVSDIVRVYLEERFNFHAPERTTDEFLAELQSTPLLTPDQKQSLGEFLQSCDLVKFARFEPTEQALRELHDSALRLVDETQYDPIQVATEPMDGSPPSASPPGDATPHASRVTS